MAERTLVVDVGNTNLVLGIFEGDDLSASWRLATARDRTADEYGILARQLTGDTAESISGAIVASVVPTLNSAVAAMISRYFGVETLFVEPGIRTGLSIVTENPLEVGADRIANAVAAFHRFGGPTIIVDFGTAITFDVVSGRGEYRGGIIAPGMNLSAEALFARAARLPRVDVRRPPHLIGTNTIASMQAGIYFGYLGLVDGILARMKSEIEDVRTVVATGTFPAALVKESHHIDEVDLELTLTGLKRIYDRNRRSKGRTR